MMVVDYSSSFIFGLKMHTHLRWRIFHLKPLPTALLGQKVAHQRERKRFLEHHGLKIKGGNALWFPSQVQEMIQMMTKDLSLSPSSSNGFCFLFTCI